MRVELLLLAIFVLSSSGLILKYLIKFDVSSINCKIPLYFAIFGILAST